MNGTEFFRRLARLYSWRWGLAIWTVLLLSAGPLAIGWWRPARITYVVATLGPLAIMLIWVAAGLAQDRFPFHRQRENDLSTDEGE